MSNIFRSKEIYKRIPGVSSDNNPLRVVQGMYVSGEYRPPYYIDGFVQVSNIKTKKATIKNYTQAEKSLRNDPVINVTDISAKKNVDIVNYKITYINTNPDHSVRVSNISTTKATITSTDSTSGT